MFGKTHSRHVNMSIRLKTKLSLGLIFLFIVIVLFGVLGLFYINRLSDEGRLVLQNNHESLVYGNRMLEALEDLKTDKNALDIFRDNLKKQQAFIPSIRQGKQTAEYIDLVLSRITFGGALYRTRPGVRGLPSYRTRLA